VAARRVSGLFLSAGSTAMEADKTISHAAYTGPAANDGYPTADQFGSLPWTGLCTAGIRFLASWTRRASMCAGSRNRRWFWCLTRHRIRRATKCCCPAIADGWFVTDVNDYTTGPFGYLPGGTITVEQVTG
jgi:hypothetical protein